MPVECLSVTSSLFLWVESLQLDRKQPRNAAYPVLDLMGSPLKDEWDVARCITIILNRCVAVEPLVAALIDVERPPVVH